MKNENQIIEELRKISLLIVKIKKTQVYSVPPLYFTDLSEKIISNINAGKECAYFFGSFAPYSIPKDYFENIAEIILQKVVTYLKEFNNVFQELEDVAPFLNTIDKKQVFSVPANFFNNIQLPSVKPQAQKAKFVSIKKHSRFFRLAAAAVIIPFLAVGLYTLTAKEFIRNNNSKAKNEVKHLSNEEIVNFLKKNSSSQDASSASQKTFINDEIKSSLKQVSDKEIQQFLKETGESDEI